MSTDTYGKTSRLKNKCFCRTSINSATAGTNLSRSIGRCDHYLIYYFNLQKLFVPFIWTPLHFFSKSFHFLFLFSSYPYFSTFPFHVVYFTRNVWLINNFLLFQPNMLKILHEHKEMENVYDGEEMFQFTFLYKFYIIIYYLWSQSQLWTRCSWQVLSDIWVCWKILKRKFRMFKILNIFVHFLECTFNESFILLWWLILLMNNKK